jgi:nucleoid-associated protein
MPVLHAIIHSIDKKTDGTPAALILRDSTLDESTVLEDLMFELNNAYNAKAGKGWGFFHAESGAFPLSGWLREYLAGNDTFVDFSRNAAEHYTRILEESNLSTGGQLAVIHYQQGMTDYITIALLNHRAGVSVDDKINVVPAAFIDFTQLQLAARINVSEWQTNLKSRQYVSYIKGKRPHDAFRDFLGVQEGVDGPSETRTLLKAFGDFVEAEDLQEDTARERLNTLVGYANSQSKVGGTISLEELSELIDEERPQAFFDHIRTKDYGLSPEIPPDKRTLKQFQRFTGRIEGLTITFEAHMLGSKIQYDETNGTLLIRNLPTQLSDQLKRRAKQQNQNA